MFPNEIISNIKQGQIDPHWIVFRYNKTRSVLMLLYKLFFAGVVLGLGGGVLALSTPPLDQETKVIVYGLLGVGSIGLLFLLHHIYTMFFLRSNMIVLTENGVVKSIRGKIFFWEYTNMTDVKQIVSQIKNQMPVYSIEFREANGTGRIFELARGREFGPSQNIFEVLKTRVQ
jgi:hypothetical protein